MSVRHGEGRVAPACPSKYRRIARKLVGDGGAERGRADSACRTSQRVSRRAAAPEQCGKKLGGWWGEGRKVGGPIGPPHVCSACRAAQRLGSQSDASY